METGIILVLDKVHFQATGTGRDKKILWYL